MIFLNSFLELKKFKYFYFLILSMLLVVFFEFTSYGLAYPIISLFLDLDNTLLLEINNFINSKTGKNIYLDKNSLILLLIFTLILQSLSFTLFRYLTVKSTTDHLFKIRSKIYNDYFSSDFNPSIKPSNILNGLTTQSMNTFYFWNAFIELIKRFLVILSLVTLFMIINFKIFFISFALIGTFFILVNKVSVLSKKYGRVMTFLDEKLINVSSQSLNNYKYLKITGIHKKFFLKFQSYIIEFNSNQLKFTMLNKILKETSEPITVILIILIGYFSVSKFGLEVSLLIISILILRRILNNVTSLFNSYQSILKFNESKIYLNNLFTQFNISSKTKLQKKIKFNSLSIKNVSFNYNKKQIFKNLNMVINKGDALVIFGKSGHGKSTLINLILNLLDRYDGKILLNNEDTHKIEIKDSIKIGIVTQEEVIFNLSLLDNLRLRNPTASKKTIINLIKDLDLYSLVDSKKFDINRKIYENNSNISGGEKQRIALAREILFEPDLLILDEATNALDEKSLDKVLKYLEKYKRKTTLLIFTHQSEYKNYDFKFFEIKNQNILNLEA